ncbi:unnamed protein product [Clonostachys rosea f. rosea IK726]|uniref:Uncharacterized protein n=1 Tax=Clonostachys rosea f. rosea IK726 TaxID=1349383 RepID=A0ACA9UDV6_BIOOC|nr:unnamed protein product [Clonostachys rosea f. rosea IK726]
MSEHDTEKYDATHIETTQVPVRLDPQKCKNVRRKIDLWLMPMLWIIYLLSYVDRTNIGLARVAGMAEDLGLTDNQYFLTVALFIIAYVVAEVPSNMILARSQPSIYISILMFLWGAVAALLALVRTPAQLIGLRFLLGVFEAGFTLPARSALSDFDMVTAIPHIISAAVFSGAFGSLISAGITSGLDGVHGIAGWRWLFIVEGVTTCAVALISPFILLDYPQTTKKFTQEERDIAYYRLLEDGVSSPTNNRLGHFKAFTLAVRDWRVWLLGFAYMSILSGFSFTYFFPTLVRGLGYQDRTMAQLMTAPLFLVALVVAIPTCWVADRMPDKRIIFIVTALAVGVIFDALAASIVSNVPRYISCALSIVPPTLPVL